MIKTDSKEFKNFMTEERIKNIKAIMYNKRPKKEIQLIDGWGSDVPDNCFTLESFKYDDEELLSTIIPMEEEELEYLYVK
jgi:hypothetical protein